MTDIVFDEAYAAEIALTKLNDPGVLLFPTMEHIARYYQNIGYRDKTIHRMLENYLLRVRPDVNLFQYQGVIQKVIRRAPRHELIRIDHVPITAGEMQTIRTLKGLMAQRVLFTLIFLAKYQNYVNAYNTSWINVSDGDVFRLANVTLTKQRQAIILHSLMEQGLIAFSKAVDNTNIQVKCLCEKSPTVLKVTDERNLGYQYSMYLGGSFVECVCCGKVIKKNSPAHKYCKECAAMMSLHRKKA